MEKGKQDVIVELSGRIGERETRTKEILEAFIDLIVENLDAGYKVKIRNFGTFEVGRNSKTKQYCPATKEFIEVEEHDIPRFRFSQSIKNRLRDL